MANLGSGTADFINDFKPKSIGRVNVKALLLDDKNYSTPNDHYFSYLNK
jgi:hypothetical protein